MAATLDGTDEPLFADNLDDYSDDEPLPLPPKVIPRSRDQGTTPTQDPIGTRDPPNTQTTPTTRGDQEGEGDGNKDEPTKKVRKPLLTLKVDRYVHWCCHGYHYCHGYCSLPWLL